MNRFLKMLAFLLCGAMLLSFAACSGGSGDATEGESESSERGGANGGEGSEATADSDRVDISEIESEAVTEGAVTESGDGNDGCDTTESRDTVISEGDRVARVVTGDGLSYTVRGYKAIENGSFRFVKGLELSFEDGTFAEEFNRMTFEYFSTEPIKLFVTYSLGGAEWTEYFFLSPEDGTFRGLIDSYLENKKGAELKGLTVDTCEETEGSFILYDLKSEVIPLYEDDLCVESDRFKIGVRLSWGGAMTYFEDKADGDEVLANLVNIHDTGRLIQQSFYGTYSNGEYVSAEYNGTKWPYNPVQGGNKYQSGSPKLIDVEVGEDYIYVLAQSLDWAHDDLLTYTYYENTYTIKEDHVVVDNVATDFSGWDHPSGGQEIPAVYIVSYFDTFSYYNGIKPWTYDDEGVCYERELGGWGASKTVPLYYGNSETWSIWINTEDDFGFGIYCPNIQKHIAMRHQYDGSKNPMANSTSYVAPSCSIVMKSYEPVEYSYILATGSPEEIRRVFTENKDFTANESLANNRYDSLIPNGKYNMFDMDFSVEENVDVVHAVKHMTKEYDSAEGAMKLTVEIPSDPQSVVDFDWNSDRVINSKEFNTIELVYMLPETNSKASYSVTFFLCAGDVTTYSEKYSVSGGIVRDGQYHTVYIKIPENKCMGDMHKIRFDPFETGAIGDTIYIKSIRFTNTPEAGIENDMTVKGSELIFSSTAHTTATFDETEGAVKLSPTSLNADVNFKLLLESFNVSAEEYVYFRMEYMLPQSNSNSRYSCTVYFDTLDSKGYSEKKTASGTMVVDGEYHTLVIKMSASELWTGTVSTLRVDYFQNGCKTSDAIYIKNISLKSESGLDIYFDESGCEDQFYSKNLTKAAFDSDEGALRLEVSGGMDVYVVLDLSKYSISTEEYSKLYIRYRVPTANNHKNYSATVYFATSDSKNYSEDKAVYSALSVDGLYHTLVIDLSQKDTWTGDLLKIRFDFFQSNCTDGDVMFIKYIKLN